jgi:hypothetical protein
VQRLLRAPRWLSSGAERVPRYDDRYETAKWRTLWLMVGFLVLVGVGIITVLRPELEDEPNEDGRAEATETEASQELDNDEPLQE